MTQLEQRLLSELERLQIERDRERQELAEEREQLARALQYIMQQLTRINTALNKPPGDGGFRKVLEQELATFSRELRASLTTSLAASLEKSNNDLIDAIKDLEAHLK